MSSIEADVRPFEPTDVPAIARIACRAWQWAYRGILDDQLLDSLTVEWFESRWASARDRSDPDRRIWMLISEGAVAGFCSTGPSRDKDSGQGTAEVYAINLEPLFVGKGLGRQLFELSVTDLGARGYRQATLWVLAGNQRARRFYEAAGWTPDGSTQTVRDWFPGFELHEVRYRRQFGSSGSESSGAAT